MNKYINLKFEDHIPIAQRYWLEHFIEEMLDFAYGYDVRDEAFDRILEILDELDVEYEVCTDYDD